MTNEKTKDIDCREALKLISAYVDKQDGEDDRQNLEKHLNSCQHCFERVEFEKLLKNRLGGLKLDTSTMKVSPAIKRLLEDL